MKVIRGLPIPSTADERTYYDFDSLRHGDAIVVHKPLSAMEMFRRFKRKHGYPRGAMRLVNGGLTEDGATKLFLVVNETETVGEGEEEV